MTSGRIADVALAVIVLETVWLLAINRRRTRPLSAIALIANVSAGAFLVLALRAALTASGWPWIALFMSAALAAHATDIVSRLRGGY